MSAGGRGADVVVAGSSVYRNPEADTVAVADGVVSHVGRRDEVMDAAGPGARVFEIDGGMILPGFQDAHVHPLHAGLAMLQVDLHETVDLADYERRITTYANRHPDAPWILGAGWAMEVFPRGTPSKDVLDRLVPERPVFLVNQDGHSGWANSRALEMAGIDANTADPRDGRIERGDDGEPQGTLHEGAMDLVTDVAPDTSVEEWTQALLLAQDRLHSLGVTSWQDAWVTEDQLAAHLAAAGDGRLRSRVALSLLWDRDRDEGQIPELIDMARAATSDRMRAWTVKIFLDGVVENFTASMLEPYLDDQGRRTGNSGLDMVDPLELKRYVTMLDDAGFQVHFHAIGDAAVRYALDACEAALETNGPSDRRHHIAHLQVVAPEDVPRFAAFDVVANCQALWACNDAQMRDLTIPFLGSDRARNQYPFGDLNAARARLAFGSDWPVSSPDPLAQMEVAVTRMTPGDDSSPPLLPEQALDVGTCIDAFTRGSAWVNHDERRPGGIEVGAAADLAVCDRDLLAVAGGRLSDARVMLTLVGGEPVHVDESIDVSA